MGQRRVGLRAAIRGTVVIAGQFDAPEIDQAERAVEAGIVDVERHRLACGHGQAVVFDIAVGRGHDRGVRNGGGVGDRRALGQVEGPGQRDCGGDAAIGVVTALDDVGRAAGEAGRAGDELVGATATAQGIHPAAAAQDVGIAVTGQRIGEGRAGDILDPGQGFGARTAAACAGCQVDRHGSARARIVGRIGSGAAVERVIAEATDQAVVAVAAVQSVIARAAIQRVIAGEAIDGVVATQSADHVREGCAVDGLTGDIAADDNAARRRRRYGLVGELQEFDIGHGHVLATADDRAGLTVPGDHIGGARAREHDRIGPEAAVDHVRAGIRREPVVGRVAAEGVRAITADGVLDHRAEGDRDVADETADAGETALAQVDDLAVVQIAREVERIGPAGIPGTEDQGAEFIAGSVPEAARIGVEAIDGVAGPGRRIDTVKTLGRRDIVHQRSGRIAPRACSVSAEVSSGLALAEIAHH